MFDYRRVCSIKTSKPRIASTLPSMKVNLQMRSQHDPTIKMFPNSSQVDAI